MRVRARRTDPQRDKTSDRRCKEDRKNLHRHLSRLYEMPALQSFLEFIHDAHAALSMSSRLTDATRKRAAWTLSRKIWQ